MATMFDDGQPEIPEGSSGPSSAYWWSVRLGRPFAVANAMAHAAVDCVVLEARVRLRGRCDGSGWNGVSR
jgi:hypothetical protein